MISGASEEELIEAIGRADVLLEFMPKIKQLQQENKQLKEIINKAIKFLEEWGKEPDADMYMLMNEYKEFNELLDILKEVSE